MLFNNTTDFSALAYTHAHRIDCLCVCVCFWCKRHQCIYLRFNALAGENNMSSSGHRTNIVYIFIHNMNLGSLRTHTCTAGHAATVCCAFASSSSAAAAVAAAVAAASASRSLSPAVRHARTTSESMPLSGGDYNNCLRVIPNAAYAPQLGYALALATEKPHISGTGLMMV